jgi:hypothetical protein
MQLARMYFAGFFHLYRRSDDFMFRKSVMLSAATTAGQAYQWRRDGINIASANSSTYSADSSGSYTCFVTNSCGSIQTNSVAVDVIPVSVSISAPATTFCQGGYITMSATEAGTGGTWQ